MPIDRMAVCLLALGELGGVSVILWVLLPLLRGRTVQAAQYNADDPARGASNPGAGHAG